MGRQFGAWLPEGIELAYIFKNFGQNNLNLQIEMK